MPLSGIFVILRRNRAGIPQLSPAGNVATRYRQRIHAVRVAIGEVFDAYGGLRQRAGTERRVPEQQYRRRQEPDRTAKRYAGTIRIFIVLHPQWRTGTKVTRFLKK